MANKLIVTMAVFVGLIASPCVANPRHGAKASHKTTYQYRPVTPAYSASAQKSVKRTKQKLGKKSEQYVAPLLGSATSQQGSGGISYGLGQAQ